MGKTERVRRNIDLWRTATLHLAHLCSRAALYRDEHWLAWQAHLWLTAKVVLPKRIANYELVRSLGVGGMAEAFEAVRHGPAGFTQRVCLKRMLEQNLAVPSAVELFLDEARLSAHLRCASIVQVYDFGEADGSYYMALELVEGENLEALLQSLTSANQRLPVHIVLYIASALLNALDYAHTLASDGEPLGIVHRDVSPSNVLISLRGEVKLTDFGIAKARGRRHRTRSGYTKGKLAYMSPEQARGEALDRRSDLFSLGIVLYELLTNRHPFESPTELELLKNIQAARFPAIEQLAPDAPVSLRLLLERLLRSKPDRRLGSAAEALQLLSFTASPYQLQQELAAIVTRHRSGAQRVSPGSDPRGREDSSPRALASPTVTLPSHTNASPLASLDGSAPGSVTYNSVVTTAQSSPRHGNGDRYFRTWGFVALVALAALATALAWPQSKGPTPTHDSAALAEPAEARMDSGSSRPEPSAESMQPTLVPAAPQALLPVVREEVVQERRPASPKKRSRPARGSPLEPPSGAAKEKSRTGAQVTADQFF